MKRFVVALLAVFLWRARARPAILVAEIGGIPATAGFRSSRGDFQS